MLLKLDRGFTKITGGANEEHGESSHTTFSGLNKNDTEIFQPFPLHHMNKGVKKSKYGVFLSWLKIWCGFSRRRRLPSLFGAGFGSRGWGH